MVSEIDQDLKDTSSIGGIKGVIDGMHQDMEFDFRLVFR